MSERSTIRYTYQDYRAIPEPIPYRRYEIVDGELFVTAAPRFRHQQVAMNVSLVLANAAVERGLGEVIQSPITVHLHDEAVVQPDVVFVAADRLEIVDPEGDVHGPPDLVVEVLSPSNRDYDRGPKRKQYLECGVPELWIVDPDRRVVEVWEPGRVDPEVVHDVLTWSGGGRALEIDVDEVFRGSAGERKATESEES